MANSAKILLVKPRYEYYPMGLAYVASTLERNGFEYDYVDSWYEEVNLEEKLKEGDYYAVGSGGLVGDYFFIEDLFKRVKQVDKSITCILGGHAARDVNYRVVFEHTPVDFAVVGEAEITLPLLLDRVIKQRRDYSDLRGIIYRSEQGIPIKNPPQRRLDLRVERVFPSHTFFDHTCWPVDRLPIPVITGRGCTGKCTFCSPSHRRFIERPLEDVFSEVETLVTQFNVAQIQFLNEILFDREETIIQFCSEYKKRFATPFCCVLRIDMNPIILYHLKDAGCIGFNIGVESGSNKVLRCMRKGITINQTRHFINIATDVGGFNITSGFMFGNEEETEEDIQETLALHDELKIQSGFSITIPYPGTAIYRKALRNKIINDEYGFLGKVHSMWSHDFRTDLLFLEDHQGRPILPNLTAIPDDRFVEVMQRAYLEFYSCYALRNPRLEVINDAIYILGKCPICNEDFKTKFDLKAPFIRNLSCSNVGLGKCYNNFEFHAHIFDNVELNDYARSVADRLADRKRIALVGERLNVKFLLDHDIFKVKFGKIVGFGSIEPSMLGRYLYSDGHGNFTPNTRIYSLEGMLALAPDAIVIAEMPPAALMVRDHILALGCDDSRIFMMCPPWAIPEHRDHFYWAPVECIPRDKKVLLWALGTYGRRILEEGIVPVEQIVAVADSNSKLHNSTFMGRKVCDPHDLAALDFDGIVIATLAFRDAVVERVQADPFLRDKDLFSASEELGFHCYVKAHLGHKPPVMGAESQPKRYEESVEAEGAL